MHFISSFITNPAELLKFPFEMFQMVSDFTILIVQQSMNFASSIMKLVV